MDVYEEADLYCAAFSWPVEDEVEWLLRTVPGARNVLEPFCGNARYAPAFVARGVEYHGIDLSAAMLARASQGPRVHLHQADVRDFRIPGVRFDLAWCPVNSIRHLLADEDVVQHLVRTREHLAPGGAYVVEIELVRWDGPWPWKPEHGGVWTQDLPDGSAVEARWRRETCDLATSTCVERATLRHVVDGRVREEATHAYTMRMWSHDDLLRLTARAGLRVDSVYLLGDDGEVRPTQLTVAAENDGNNRYVALRPA